MEQLLERTVVAVAHALFINRLHVLRLTEVVRLGVKPDPKDGELVIPDELDHQLQDQAINYVLAYLPSEFHVAIHQAKVDWLRPT